VKGMVLAAGFGTRLGELTKSTPKCLVEAGGRKLLEHTLRRLHAAKVSECVVNLHHLPEQVTAFLDTFTISDLTIHRSFESTILETGGGLKAARRYFSPETEPLFVHNADVYTTLALSYLAESHTRLAADATLLVTDKPSSRGLLVDDSGALCGWVSKDARKVVRDRPNLRLVNFSGIQVTAGAIFNWMEGLGSYFSIIEAYLAGVSRGANVLTAPLPGGERWFDVGTPERLDELRRFLDR
jgi:MurNAc alpha-1-phosphate uridylyltransferase